VFGSHLHFVTPTNAQSSSVGLAWNGSPLWSHLRL
jgi:hypothetical protein